jgi:hypothetical protein
VALSWGIWRLLADLAWGADAIRVGNGDWTFGQLVSVIMLVAPLISIVGTLNDGESF